LQGLGKIGKKKPFKNSEAPFENIQKLHRNICTAQVKIFTYLVIGDWGRREEDGYQDIRLSGYRKSGYQGNR